MNINPERLYEKPNCKFYSKCSDQVYKKNIKSICPKICKKFLDKSKRYNTLISINCRTFPVIHFQPNSKIRFI
jgi:hypothetical protein